MKQPLSLALYRRLAWGLGLCIWGCMLGQVFLLHQMGSLTPATALPLHLCSFNGLIALPVLLTRRQSAWEFMLYLGLPGALGALFFPCVIACPWQGWMDFFFLSLHCLLVLAPLLPWAAGMRPRRRPWGVLIWGNLLAVMALAANRLFHANFLFLSFAPAQTPLTLLHRWGPAGYLGILEGLCLVLCCIGNPKGAPH